MQQIAKRIPMVPSMRRSIHQPLRNISRSSVSTIRAHTLFTL